MSERGVFAVDRGIWDHPTLDDGEPLSSREAFVWLISEAAFRPHRAKIGSRTVSVNRGQVAHSYRFLAERWRWSLGKVQRFLKRLETDTMIETQTDTGMMVITICNYDKYQRVSLPGDTPADTPADTRPIQIRRHEIKQDTLLCENEAKAEKQKPLAKPVGKTIPNEHFDKLWSAYPKREGPQPKHPARQKFDALVKSGVDPGAIVAGALAFAAAEAKRGTVGTRFIPHLTTWLNARQWEDFAPVSPADAADAGRQEVEGWRRVVEPWRKDPTTWSSHAWGPPPGRPGCRIPTPVLAELGLPFSDQPFQPKDLPQ